MKRFFLLLSLLMTIGFSAFSQEKQEINTADYSNSSVEMADAFREDGKIYVVVAVILVLLIGLFVYLVILDRKIGRLEKQYGNSGD